MKNTKVVKAQVVTIVEKEVTEIICDSCFDEIRSFDNYIYLQDTHGKGHEVCLDCVKNYTINSSLNFIVVEWRVNNHD